MSEGQMSTDRPTRVRNRPLSSVPLWLSGLLLTRGAPRGTDRASLRADATASITVFAVLVPSALAYGELAGVTSEAGLYVALAAMLVYAVLGTSRQLIVGPEATSALLAATAVAPLVSRAEPERYAACIAMLALLVGGFLLLGSLARIGFLADFLSRPILAGYMAGTALIVIASQLGKLAGLSLAHDAFFPRLWEFGTRLGQAHGPTLVLGLLSIGLLVALKRLAPGVPGALVAVVLGTAAAAMLGLEARGVSVTGEITPGLPSLGLPQPSLEDTWALAPAAATMALLSFADSVLTARSFAARHGYTIDANRELLALGLANVGAGLVRGFPISTSGSRTAVSDGAGGASKRVGLFAALLLVPFLLFLTPLLQTLPHVVLASVVIVASAGLIDWRELRRLMALRRAEYRLALLTLLGVLTLGILAGVLVAVTLSLLDVVARICRPHDAVLGHLDSVDAYVSLDGGQGVLEEPRLIVYRFDAPLFFANTGYFRERIDQLIAQAPAPAPPHGLLLDAQAITSLDTSAVATLTDLLDDLDRRGIHLTIARANGPVVSLLRRSGLVDRIGPSNITRTVRAGVQAFREQERNPAAAADDAGGTASDPASDTRTDDRTYPRYSPRRGM